MIFFFVFSFLFVVCFLIICLAHCINSWHVLCCQIGDKLTALLILTALPEQDDDEDGDDDDDDGEDDDDDGDDDDEAVDVELVDEFVNSMLKL